MPKAYSAPIPIYRPMGQTARQFEMTNGYPWPVMTSDHVAEGVWRLRNFAADRGETALADHLGRYFFSPEWEQHWTEYISLIESSYVLDSIEDIRHQAWVAERLYALTAHREPDDAEDVDDFFLTYCNPQIYAHLDALSSAGDGLGSDEALSEYLEREASMTDRYSLNKERLRKITQGKKALVCWHEKKSHSELRRRGRQWTPARRAATWATYCLAWLTGSESTAVRLWNAYGHDARWGTDDKSGIKVYGATKRRLVKSLVWAMGVAVTPPNSSVRPYNPLPQDVLDRVLASVQSIRASGEAPPVLEPQNVTVEA